MLEEPEWFGTVPYGAEPQSEAEVDELAGRYANEIEDAWRSAFRRALEDADDV